MGRTGYRQDEAQAILRRAVRESAAAAAPEAGVFSHRELRQMASELGIDEAMLDRAARAWDAEQRESRERRAFAASRRRAFWAHLAPYLLVNTMLVAINLATCPGYFWAVWPILGWGVGIVSHGWYALPASGECFEKEFQAWKDSRRQAGSAAGSEAAA
jgi:hypothetical protein